jgi:hypothetical protein
MDNPPKPLLTPNEFSERIVPELLRRWENHCFCRSPKFIKLVSFNFKDYGNSPMSLIDAELMIGNIIFKRFEPVSGWVDSAGGSDRVDRCPQCAEIFQSRWDQYSISMDRTTARPRNPLPIAPIGDYTVAIHYFRGGEESLRQIKDFRVADSVEDFIAGITNVE